MALTKKYLRTQVAQIAGDYSLQEASDDGAADGSTIILAALNGRQTDADLGKWVVVTFDDDDVRASYISASNEGTPEAPTDYTLFLTPALGDEVEEGMDVEIMAYPPIYYTTAINQAVTNVYPWLYRRLYNQTIEVESQTTYSYDLPAGVDSSDITRVMMTGLPNTPFANVGYIDLPDFTFEPTGTAGAMQLWLNRIGAPFLVSPISGCNIVLQGWTRLTGVAADPNPYVINDDSEDGPELTEGSQYDVLLREWVLAYLWRTLMSAPSTPDRQAYAASFQAQMGYAQERVKSNGMQAPEWRRAQ